MIYTDRLIASLECLDFIAASYSDHHRSAIIAQRIEKGCDLALCNLSPASPQWPRVERLKRIQVARQCVKGASC